MARVCLVLCTTGAASFGSNSSFACSGSFVIACSLSKQIYYGENRRRGTVGAMCTTFFGTWCWKGKTYDCGKQPQTTFRQLLDNLQTTFREHLLDVYRRFAQHCQAFFPLIGCRTPFLTQSCWPAAVRTACRSVSAVIKPFLHWAMTESTNSRSVPLQSSLGVWSA